MARLSFNEVTTYRWSFEDDVAHYAAAGLQAMGVWRQKLSDFGEEKGIELLAEHRMAVSNLVWAGGFTGSDGRGFRDSMEDALDAMRLAAQMQAGCLVVYTGGRSGHTFNHARRLVKEALTELISAAEDHEITLAIEPMHAGCASEWTYLTSIDETLALLDSLASPRAKMVLDTYHFGHDSGLLDRLAELVPWIAVVHLGDGKCPPQREQDRCRLGEGTVPLAEITRALEAGGYQGDYDVELLGEEIQSADYAELIRHSQAEFARWQSV